MNVGSLTFDLFKKFKKIKTLNVFKLNNIFGTSY